MEEEPAAVTVVLADNEQAACLLGRNDENLRIIEQEFPAHIVARGNELVIRGDPEVVAQVGQFVEELARAVRAGHIVTPREVRYAARQLHRAKKGTANKAVFFEPIMVSDRGKPVKPRTVVQNDYVQAIRTHDLVFGIGPAGTGKTYLAVACAVAALQRREVSRIVLTRPAVEAGEKLGFLPGDIQAKVDPYLRPLFDALYDLLDTEKLQRLLERSVIEVAPLAFMRGRTLNDSFIILDEAQNTSREQMMMFLTRMGFGSRAVVTGDVTQIDLPGGQVSGLKHAREILSDVEGICFVHFSDEDVVRHELVRRIILAYEKAGPPRRGAADSGPARTKREPAAGPADEQA